MIIQAPFFTDFYVEFRQPINPSDCQSNTHSPSTTREVTYSVSSYSLFNGHNKLVIIPLVDFVK